MTKPFTGPLPMSYYNRLPDPICEYVAIQRVRLGDAIIIDDEPETREFKPWEPLDATPISEIAKSIMGATLANEPENEKKIRGIKA